MNFPGLDPAYMLAHRAGHAVRLIKTWSLPETRTALEQGEKVLVVATTALGDSVLTTPLIETLSRNLGPDRVSLLVKTPYIELYQPDPRLHRVFSVRGKYRWGGLREKLDADPHRIALLANMTEPDLVPFLWRCGVRGFLRYRTRWTRYPDWMANESMLRRPGAPDYATGHAIENNLAMAKALGMEPATHRLALPHLVAATDGQERGISDSSRRLARDQALAGGKLGRVSPTPWPIDSRCAIALTGDRSEHSLAARIAAAMRRRPRNSGRKTVAARTRKNPVASARFSLRRHGTVPPRRRGRLPDRDAFRAHRPRFLHRGVRSASGLGKTSSRAPNR